VRITVTVVDLSNAWSADVLVDADPDLPVSAWRSTSRVTRWIASSR
jgi:hypothetical protein